MPALDAIVLPECDPPLLLGLELHFLAAMHAGRSLPALIVCALPGHLISIGRYHLYGGPERRGGVRALRRLTGGRIVGAGHGWVETALLLPGWSAIPAARGLPLKPDQVMNRCVRGALAALRTMGLDCLYPGRDAVTVERREIAICSFETDASGALLFELMLAVGRGMEDLVHDLERFDPDGALVCPMYSREAATNVARELKREASFAEVADALARGYASMLGEVERRRLDPAERTDAERRGAELAASGWLNTRKPDPALDKAGRTGSQLGFIQAHLKLADGAAIERIMLSGDFIANSPGLARFERELVGMPLNLPSVSDAAMRVFGDGSNYILGVGELDNLVKLVTRAT